MGIMSSEGDTIRRLAEIEAERLRLMDVPKYVSSYWRWKRPPDDDRNVVELKQHGKTEDCHEFQLRVRVCHWAWHITFIFSDGAKYRYDSDGVSFDSLTHERVSGPHVNYEPPTGEKRTFARPDLGLRFRQAMALVCAEMNVEHKYGYKAPPAQETLDGR